MTVEECLIIYGEAWFERDAKRRVEVLRRCCTEDIVFVDPMLGRLEGLEAVSNMIGSYASAMSADGDGTDDATTDRAETNVSKPTERGRSDGGVSVEVVTAIDRMHGFFRYSFVWTLPSGRRSGGTDFCELADDGRMRLITVWPATDDFPLPAKAQTTSTT